ncbi:Cullin-4A [Galdieria sulphuraria]|nr:Cullin-4A [Galdieria sulphuraria]
MPYSPARRSTRRSSSGTQRKRGNSLEGKTNQAENSSNRLEQTSCNKKPKKSSKKGEDPSQNLLTMFNRENSPQTKNDGEVMISNGKLQQQSNQREPIHQSFSTPQKSSTKLVIRPLASAPAVSKNFAEEIWINYLKQAVKAIQNATKVVFSYEELYRKVEDVCLLKWGSFLFEKLQEEVEQHVAIQINSLQGYSHESETFLYGVSKVWEEHCNQMKLIRSIFLFLDRSFVLHNAPVRSLWDMGLKVFRKYLQQNSEVEKKTVQSTIALITAERKGESIPQDLVKDMIRMFTALEIYGESFEKAFLDASSEYYNNEGNVLLQQYDIYTYLKHVEIRLSEEVNRVVHYLDRITKAPLIQLVENCLLESHTVEILDKGFDNMMEENRQEDLARLYRLLARVHQLDQVKKYLGIYTKSTGARIIQDPEKDNELVQLILDMKDKVDSIVSNCFDKNETFQYAVKESFESFVNMRQNKPAELTAKYIDQILRTGNKGYTEEELEGTLDKVLQFFRFIHGKDVFEAFYKKDLAKRLLLGKSASLDLEKTMISKLKAECGAGFTSKLEGMFKDIDLSQDIMKAFYESLEWKHCGNEVDLSVVVLTSSYWPQSTCGDVKLSKELLKLQNAFSRFYLNKYAGRKLTWNHSNNISVVII